MFKPKSYTSIISTTDVGPVCLVVSSCYQKSNTKSETCAEQYGIKFPNGMTWGKMLLSGHFYNTMLDGVLYSLCFFLCTYMTIKVTIIYTVDPMPQRSSVLQPLIPPKRLYAQKVQARFDMYYL